MMTLCIYDAERFNSIAEAVESKSGYDIKSAPNDEEDNLVKRAKIFAKKMGWKAYSLAIAKE